MDNLLSKKEWDEMPEEDRYKKLNAFFDKILKQSERYNIERGMLLENKIGAMLSENLKD
jgi:hypothetical protein